MSEDRMRAEFEEWLCSEGRTPRDDYKDAMWHAWQASRKALCVELPEEFDLLMARSQGERVLSSAHNVAIRYCKAALDKAGIAYKDEEYE